MSENLKADLKITPYVFVYGTLKKSFHNNHYIGVINYVCEALTKSDTLALINMGIPYLITTDTNGKRVLGEVYKIDEEILESLDRLEGVNYGHYERRLIDVGLPQKAWAYFATAETFSRLDNPPYCDSDRGYYEY